MFQPLIPPPTNLIKYVLRIWIFLLIITFSMYGAEYSFSETLPGERSEIVIPDSTGKIQLSYKYIDTATLQIVSLPTKDSLQIGEYDFDPTLGLLQLLHPPFPDSLLVRYRHLPVEVIDTLSIRSIKDIETLPDDEEGYRIIPRQTEGHASILNDSKLRSSGHILRGVQVGNNRDVSLESGLRLSLEGELARDVHVRALLDDRSLPLQPEGTSQRLEEIDQVYIEMDANKLHGRFGDYNLDWQGGRYGTIDRRLEGATVDYTLEQGFQPGYRGYDSKANEIISYDDKVSAAGAVSRAVFHSNRFTGRDGVQGPYRLRGRNGEQTFTVIGGSEKVYLDGQLQSRGENAAYVIDYNRGDITFTPRVSITSESRIEVDFEYSPEAFPINLYAGHIQYTNEANTFQVQSTAISEGDDPDRPIAFEMTPEIRDQFQGSDTIGNRAAINGADSLGFEEGDYVRVDTTWSDGQTYTIFRYLSPDEDGKPNGSWGVYFSEVGSGLGSYRRQYDPITGSYSFHWVGISQGSWSPVRLIPLPQRLDQAAVNMKFKPHSSLSFVTDIAGSRENQNLLADNPAENDGLAYQVQTAWNLPREGIRPGIRLSANVRQEEAKFRAIGRSREVEYERKWGIDSLDQNQFESEFGGSAIVTPHKNIQLLGDFGGLERGENFTSERGGTGLKYSTTHLRYDSYLENIHSENSNNNRVVDWQRGRGELSRLLQIYGDWRPGVEGEFEEKDETVADSLYYGYQYDRLRGFLELVELEGHSGIVAFENRQRNRQEDNNSFSSLYNENAANVRWQWQPVSHPFRSSLEWTRRDKQYQIADSADVISTLGAASIRFMPFNGALNTDLNYSLNQTLQQSQALIAYQVPAGEGEYIRVGDEYVYDPEIGNYILRTQPEGESIPTTDLAAFFQIDWSPDRLPDGKGEIEGFGWEDISLVTQAEVREMSTWEQTEDIYLLNLKHFQSDSTIEGRMLLRQDVHLFRPSRVYNLRLRYEAEKTLENLYTAGQQRYGSDLLGLRQRQTLGNSTDLESNASYSRKYKRRQGYGSSGEFRLYRAGIKLSRQMNRHFKFSFDVRGLQDRELQQETLVNGLGVTPGITYAMRDKGRVTADFEALWLESDTTRIPFDLADGRPIGRNGRANFRVDFKIGQYFTARASYTARFDQGREPIHVARMEVSAAF
ncbi:hypothetical protein K8I28_06295 [bacterium]|nr:hypothetical protein [bacterium]